MDLLVVGREREGLGAFWMDLLKGLALKNSPRLPPNSTIQTHWVIPTGIIVLQLVAS